MKNKLFMIDDFSDYNRNKHKDFCQLHIQWRKEESCYTYLRI